MDKNKILKRIKKENGCWIWQGAKRPPMNYGHLTTGSRTDRTRKTISAHRYSYLCFNGNIPNKLWVLHRCDNPSCVNPKHLYLGTRKDNVKDMMDRGRLNHACGEDCPKSKLTQKQVISIRKERKEKGTTFRELARKNKLKSHKSVIDICIGKSWKHLLPEPPIS